MSPPEGKKRVSGRDPEKKTQSKKSAPSGGHHHEIIEDGRELHSPWLPLIWMLIPLFACVAYGLATRN